MMAGTSSKHMGLILGNEHAKRKRLREALQLAAFRLEIAAGRMRACHEETGKHELLDEIELFVTEARESVERDLDVWEKDSHD